LMVMRGFAIREAEDAEVVFVAGAVSASYPNLQMISIDMLHQGGQLTVDVISAEQTSQTYFTPPSAPRAAVFLRITPIAASPGGYAPPWERRKDSDRN
jgi:hypothetical protein